MDLHDSDCGCKGLLPRDIANKADSDINCIIVILPKMFITF